MLDLNEAWALCSGLLALAALWRGFENAMRRAGESGAPWGRVLAYLSVLFALWAGWFAVKGPLNAWPWALLCVVGSLESMRAKGLEQGGSDPMTLWLRLFVAVACASNERMRELLAVLACGLVVASYFCAGLAKARNPEWWNGRALRAYLRFPAYRCGADRLLELPTWVLAATGIAVLLFELMAPLVFFDAPFLSFWCLFGVLFHGLNVLFFGLHRFFWVWLSSYPLLFALMQG